MADNIQFDVFLSCNSKDKAEVELFTGWLRNENIRIWFDKWELRPAKSISVVVIQPVCIHSSYSMCLLKS